MKLAWTKIALISLLSVIPLAADDEAASTSSPLPSHHVDAMKESLAATEQQAAVTTTDEQQQQQQQQQDDDRMATVHEDELNRVQQLIDNTSENDTEESSLLGQQQEEEGEANKAQHELIDTPTTPDDLERIPHHDNESEELDPSIETNDSTITTEETESDVSNLQDVEPPSHEQIQDTPLDSNKDGTKDRIEEELEGANDTTEAPALDPNTEHDTPVNVKPPPESTEHDQPPPQTIVKKQKEVVVDYASKSTGAIILDKSSEFKGTSKLLVDDTDQYAIAPCHPQEGDDGEAETKYVIIGLSEDILIKTIKLKSFERYSSQAKQFQVLGSQTYPMMTEWETLGSWEAKPWFQNNQEQTFDLDIPSWARYLKFKFLTHYGDEHYCTVTQIKVHGSTTLQGFHEMQWETIGDDHDDQEEEEQEEQEDEKSTTEDGDFEQHQSHDKVEEEDIMRRKEENTTILMEDENVLISDEKGENEEGADDTGSGENTITQVAANALLNSMNVETTDDAGEKEQGTLLESQQDNSDSQVVIQNTNETISKKVTVEVEEETTEEVDVEVYSSEEPLVSSESVTVADPSLQIGELNNLDDNSFNEMINVEEDQEEVDSLPKNTNILDSEPNGSALSAASIKTSSSKLLENSKETISSTVNSAIKSVKEAHYVNDAMQGLKDIINAKVKAENPIHGSNIEANENEEVILVMQDMPPLENEGRLTKDENNSNDKQTQTIQNDIESGEKSDSSDNSERGEEDQESLENDASNSNEDDNNVGNEMNDVDKQSIPPPPSLFELTEKFPSAACLETLTFQHFKSKVIKAGTTGTNNGAGSLAVPKNEPIFKKLADEIKSLHINQGIYDQYIKAATKCYHQVISDMTSEIVSLQGEQEHRLSQLEAKMRDQIMKNEKGYFEDMTLSLYDNSLPLVSDAAKSAISYAYNGITMIGDTIVSSIESLITSKLVQGFIAFVKDYISEVVSFLAGSLFCFIFISVYLRLQRTRKNKSDHSVQNNEQAKPGKSASRRKRRKNKRECSIDQQLPPLEIEELTSRE